MQQNEPSLPKTCTPVKATPRKHRLIYSHNVRAIRANRLQAAIRNFWCPETRFAIKKEGFSSGTLRQSRIKRDKLNGICGLLQTSQGVLQGVAFVGVQVLR